MKKLLMILCLALCLTSFTGCAATPEKPPMLTVICGGQTATTGSGSYSWNYRTLSGHCAVDACGIHPLDAKDHTQHLETAGTTATLQIGLEPDSVYAKCWSDEHWGNTDAESSMAMVSNGELTLRSGGTVYEIHASWEGRGYSGSATYVIWITSTAEELLPTDLPTLTVGLGEKSFSVPCGTATWRYTAEDGKESVIQADGNHPLLMLDAEDRIDTKEELAALKFSVVPDRIEAFFWSEEQLGNTEELINTDPGMRGNLVNLYEGGYIYAVHAYWESREEYQGDALYYFYIRRK